MPELVVLVIGLVEVFQQAVMSVILLARALERWAVFQGAGCEIAVVIVAALHGCAFLLVATILDSGQKYLILIQRWFPV